MGDRLEMREHIATAPAIGRDGSAFIGAPEPRRASSGAAGEPMRTAP